MTSLEKGMLEAAAAFARERMARLHSSHGWDHVERVALLAEKIAATEPAADLFILRASVLLHDIARIDEAESGGRICHAGRGSALAFEYLSERGLDRERAGHVRDSILTHRFRNDHAPASIEAKILYDADKLDSIGAVGIGRAFLFSGEVGARLHNPDIDVLLTEAYGKEDTAYREYMVKLRYISDNMLTVEGTRRADNRHRFMVEFFERLQDEVRGDI